MFVELEKHLGDFLEEIFKGFACKEKKYIDWIFDNLNIDVDKNDDIGYSREVDLLNYGIVDFQLKINKTIYLVEIKKGKIGLTELGQISKYITGAKKLYPDDVLIKPILIGSGFDKSNVCFIYNELENLFIYFYDFDFADGLSIYFQERRWVFTENHDG